jgi:sporulation protein YlmC with PRC-barrel domain
VNREEQGEVVDSINIVKGNTILCADGPLGEVHDVLINPETQTPTHIIWRKGITLTKEVNIPIGYVQKIEGNNILLRVGKEDIERLPHFWW